MSISMVLVGISLMQAAAPADVQPDVATLAQAVDRCMATHAVRLTRTDAADEAIFAQATEGCAPLKDQLLAAITRGYSADQAQQLQAAIEANARPNFMRLLQRIRSDRQNRAAN